MLKPEDISQIIARGSTPETIAQQIRNFENGFPFLKLTEAATNYHGIIRLSKEEIAKYCSVYEQQLEQGLKTTKFVPASGAASRMFKSLFAALEKLRAGIPETEVMEDHEILKFKSQLRQYAFYDDLSELAARMQQTPESMSLLEILELLLNEEGLNYGNLPKGLLKFHRYNDTNRTAAEEHFVEGAGYSKNADGKVKLHFTISPEHKDAFEEHIKAIQTRYEKQLGVDYEVSFSFQKPSTDTLAVDLENEPFRNEDGSLLFRPAGHGALLPNLNELEADVVFIKNIDNVVPDELKPTTITYKKALAGVLISLQEQLYHYQKTLKEHYPATLESAFYAEAANFLENILNITPPSNQYYSEKEELHHYFSKKFNRPTRVCGMVKNEGEPGGGPFFAICNDQSVSLQIVESSQIDHSIPEQKQIAENASHFNPVDLVCGIRNYAGEKYDLMEFTDPKTGFISIKSKDGKELKAQELPGLWNGSMSDWNTIFVEVPIETFNPVKTVNDLLRKEHQA